MLLWSGEYCRAIHDLHGASGFRDSSRDRRPFDGVVTPADPRMGLFVHRFGGWIWNCPAGPGVAVLT